MSALRSPENTASRTSTSPKAASPPSTDLSLAQSFLVDEDADSANCSTNAAKTPPQASNPICGVKKLQRRPSYRTPQVSYQTTRSTCSLTRVRRVANRIAPAADPGERNRLRVASKIEAVRCCSFLGRENVMTEVFWGAGAGNWFTAVNWVFGLGPPSASEDASSMLLRRCRDREQHGCREDLVDRQQQ